MIKVRADCRGMTPDEIRETIMMLRGVEEEFDYLYPSSADILPLDALPNVDKAAQVVLKTIENPNCKFIVHYDVDVDGVCSGTIMKNYLEKLRVKPEIMINEGKAHGIVNPQEIIDKHPDVLIIVDSLNSDNENYKLIHDAGIQIVILDHHNVNPNIDYDSYVTLVTSQTTYPNHELSGSGVVFKFCQYLDSLIGTDYAESMYDLAATGLVADMMDVSVNTPENRAIIYQGLENLNNFGLKQMVGKYEFNSKAISFSIAPKINASMRTSQNELAVNALQAHTTKEAKELISRMEEAREYQRESVKEMKELLEPQVEEQKDYNVFVLKANRSDFLGLVANQIASEHHKPAVVVYETPIEGMYKGSGRGWCSEDLNTCVNNTGCGKAMGHPAAFGVEIEEDSFETFKTKINETYFVDADSERYDADIMLDIFDLNSDLIDWIKEFNRISGQGAPEIKVAIPVYSYSLGTTANEKHLIAHTQNMDFIKWNYQNVPNIYEELSEAQMCGDRVYFIGSIEQGYMGRVFSKRLIVDKYIF